MEHFTRVSVALGFPLLTLGLITGLVRAFSSPHGNELGPQWYRSPKVLLAFGAWAVYALVLHAPINPSFRGRRAALLSVVGFCPDDRRHHRGAIHAESAVAPAGFTYLSNMQRLLLLGLNHTTAPLEVREKLAFSADQRDEAIAAFRERFPDWEAVLLSTCNRVELYVARAAHEREREPELIEFLAAFHSLHSCAV